MPLQETSGAASYDAFGGGSAAVPTYIEDVFSTWLYTGNGATQTITNGIDLAGKGGLVWAKSRSGVLNHVWTDTVRGAGWYMSSNTQFPQTVLGQNSDINGFTSTGFDLRFATGDVNTSGELESSWTFRKQPKFFDVVQYSGTGAAQSIPHSLGSEPGFMIVKRMNGTGNWWIYHRSWGRLVYFRFSTLTGSILSTVWNDTAPTSTQFTVGTSISVSGGTYIAYLFAHNAGGFGLAGTDNVISCDSYVGNGSTSGPIVSLGYEPQWVMIKRSDGGTGSWQIFDNMRGMPVGSADATLVANTTAAETSVEYLSPTSTGFQITSASSEVNTSGNTYIYVAIRRGPMKVPTDGTSVFSPIAVNNATGTTNTTNFSVDLQLQAYRAFTANKISADRLRGISTTTSESGIVLQTTTTNAESSSTVTLGWDNTGFKTAAGYASSNAIYWNFRRAPGYFDEVCYNGNGDEQYVTHNLTVPPELMIVKRRNSAADWYVYSATTTALEYLVLNTTAASVTDYFIWSLVTPTSTEFTVYQPGIGETYDVNKTGGTYVAYLFATCPGVSKVGTYTGTGLTKPVNCNLTGPARFLLIKAISTTGNWYVWDSARGIVTGSNDPYLELNTTNAEVTTTNWLHSVSGGFVLTNSVGNLANTSGVNYIFLAIG